MSDAQAVPIVVPPLGTEGTGILIGQWLVDDAEQVLESDRLVELLTDGVLFHLASPAEGRVERHLTREGTHVAAGTVLGLIHRSNITEVPEPNTENF